MVNENPRSLLNLERISTCSSFMLAQLLFGNIIYCAPTVVIERVYDSVIYAIAFPTKSSNIFILSQLLN
jgi:hypothetical protein